MNDYGATLALRELAVGNKRQVEALVSWLAEKPTISGRYLTQDLRDAAINAANGEAGDGGLQTLLDDLTNREDSVLIALFPTAVAGATYDLPGARIGPANDVVPALSTHPGLESWFAENGRATAVLTSHPAQGRLGAIRTASWLQTVLGAIGLAAYAHSGRITSIGLCPALGTTMFLGSDTTARETSDQAAWVVPLQSAAELDGLLCDNEAKALILDAAAQVPSGLVQERLTLASRWLQLASSAIDTADAVIALGIALETITGDNSREAVVDRTKRRAAVFLANAVHPDDRGDVYYDELKRADRFYGWRSQVAHGRYDALAHDQTGADAERHEFHRFVLDVALSFRQRAYARNLQSFEDFMKWWKRVELEGISA